jgi:chromosome segregation ATPase
MAVQEAVAQINQKADATITRLSARLFEIEQTIRSAHSEIEAFPKQREAIAAKLNSEREKLATLHAALKKAEAYAKVAIGTLGEKGAIKKVSDAKRALASGQKYFDAIEGQMRQEQDVADAREQEVHAHIATLQGEYSAIQAELHTTQIAKEQAHRELGELNYTAITDQLNERQRRIDELKAQLVALQVEHHDAVESSIQELADWVDHRSQLRKQYPAHDEMVDVLEHEIAYITALLRNAQSLAYNERLYSLFAVPVNELHYGEHLQRNPKALRSRLAELQTLLSEHQALLQQ